ncbi:MAG: fused MFS/spermidine synthase, partial [Candidatus Hydrogenedentota bacterium]
DILFPVIIGVLYFLIDLTLVVWISPLGRFAGFAAMIVPAILCLMMLRKPLCFSLALGVLLMAGVFYQDYHGQIVSRSRSFFGVYKVARVLSPPSHTLSHGSTIHGRQSFEPDRIDEPLSYYHTTGPVGQVYSAFALGDTVHPVAVVGLGAGSMATYAEPGRRMDFYEIDPAVARIALDTRCFLYLSRANGILRIRLGDARLSLRDAKETYGLIVLDAFSSDAIPVHLLTKEALGIYLSRLSENGILAFHISNRYLDLEPILRNLAADHGLFCLYQSDVRDERMQARGIGTSLWMAMSRHEKAFDKAPMTTGGWIMEKGSTGMRIWTDDYSPIAEIFRWR